MKDGGKRGDWNPHASRGAAFSCHSSSRENKKYSDDSTPHPHHIGMDDDHSPSNAGGLDDKPGTPSGYE